MISFQNVSVSFIKGDNILTDITFQAQRGSFTYISGRSGAGKTTLLRLIYADLKPSGGIVNIAGNDITGMPQRLVPFLRRQIGIVFQDFKLIENSTVYDNVKLPLDIFRLSRPVMDAKIDALLERLGIINIKHATVRTLSGGEKQRVAIARALINEPFIIIADEPTGNVDVENAYAITELLHSVAKNGTTVLMATHDLLLKKMFPAREISLDRGRLVLDTKV